MSESSTERGCTRIKEQNQQHRAAADAAGTDC
jgi:hypothetical protein